ncbi:MAG: BamA/TamA family outer membrane protein [Bacteroidetes bacterium]|nr:BamA/TamA family outer membrane protein [Bacteroidota bacterium]
MKALFGKYPNLLIGPAIFFATVFFISCGVKKTIPEGQHLLRKNKVHVYGKIPTTEISGQILHRANKRVIFNRVPIYLWAYALGTKHEDPGSSDSSKLRRKLRHDFGEPPVLMDTNLVVLSADNIHNYLFNTGYFDAVVTTKVVYSKRKAKVFYYVHPKEPFLINSVFMRPVDSSLYPEMQRIAEKSDYFRLWWPANLNKLGEARNFMAAELQNLGYYTIKPELIRFRVDTLSNKTSGQKEAEIKMILENQANNEPHVKYKFGAVKLVLETSEMYTRTRNPKTVYYDGNTLELNHYPIMPATIARIIYVDSGAIYSQNAGNKTYQSLVQMGLFSFVEIVYTVDTSKKEISSVIHVKTSPRMYFQVEPQALYSPQGSSGLNISTGTQRSFGGALILSFSNKNLFRNVENLRISSITSYEGIIKRDNKNTLGYALQQGFNASLSLPHLKLMNLNKINSKITQRNTLLSLSYQYERNPNFFRSAIPASITFQYLQPKISYYWTPVEISFNKNILSKAFIDRLPAADSAFISRVFTNQFVSATKIGFIYANNRTKPGETYVFTRLGMETSGNLHRTYRKLFENPFISDSTYTIFGLQYFQYAKLEGEIRLRQIIDELNSVVLRVNSGIAIPYGNSRYVPYDKRYFIGGSNSLRAWRPRRLGPGSTSDTTNFIIDRSGEFLLEGNLEYRFTLLRKLLESALFLDIGNIWNLDHKGQTAPAASILNSDKLFQDMAVNTGIGFRFDFQFFLFRIDWGIPLRDPSREIGTRWLIGNYHNGPWNFVSKETALAFGIGYPF